MTPAPVAVVFNASPTREAVADEVGEVAPVGDLTGYVAQDAEVRVPVGDQRREVGIGVEFPGRSPALIPVAAADDEQPHGRSQPVAGFAVGEQRAYPVLDVVANRSRSQPRLRNPPARDGPGNAFKANRTPAWDLGSI